LDTKGLRAHKIGSAEEPMRISGGGKKGADDKKNNQEIQNHFPKLIFFRNAKGYKYLFWLNLYPYFYGFKKNKP